MQVRMKTFRHKMNEKGFENLSQFFFDLKLTFPEIFSQFQYCWKFFYVHRKGHAKSWSIPRRYKPGSKNLKLSICAKWHSYLQRTLNPSLILIKQISRNICFTLKILLYRLIYAKQFKTSYPLVLAHVIVCVTSFSGDLFVYDQNI